MASAFDRAAAAIFGNADLGVAATHYPGGNLAAGVLVTVILSRADQDSEFGEARVRGANTVASVAVAAVPEFAKGDLLAIGSETFRVVEAPERDASRTIWRAALARVV